VAFLSILYRNINLEFAAVNYLLMYLFSVRNISEIFVYIWTNPIETVVDVALEFNPLMIDISFA
jgi:hypothetical protein